MRLVIYSRSLLAIVNKRDANASFATTDANTGKNRKKIGGSIYKQRPVVRLSRFFFYGIGSMEIFDRYLEKILWGKGKKES